MITGATMFSGFEGVGLGMRAAGVTHVWGIELDPAIAAVAQTNGFAVTVANILECDPYDFEPVDVLHASPPCPNFSVAKAGAQETELDIALGRKVTEFIDALRPSVFTLENVYGYRKAQSFRHIVKRLRRLGYHVKWWHLNAADYGVPQTRKRLILAAALDFTPQRPPATHREPGKHEGQLSLFGDKLPPWVGWYEAIEDLIPELPDSRFADWQLARLPEGLQTLMIGGANTSKEQAAPGVGVSQDNEPTRVVAGNSDRWRAFVSDHRNAGRDATNRAVDEPFWTVATGELRRPSSDPRALTPQGRVVRMTPRALARFQSFPDDYELPDSKTLACRGIGNAVPPLLYHTVLEALL